MGWQDRSAERNKESSCRRVLGRHPASAKVDPGQEHAGVTDDRHAGVIVAGIQDLYMYIRKGEWIPAWNTPG